MPSYTAVYSQGRTRAFFASASTTLVGLLMASQAWGSGFQIKEQNITNLGTAYAGTAAHAADASSAWYNPAAITRIKKHQLVIAGAFIHADNEFNPDFATNMAGTVLPSRGEEEANKLSFVPSLHYTAEINDHVYLGLSVTTPFGLATEYSENSILRYMATRSELRTVDISPVLLAVLICVVPMLFVENYVFSQWLYRALVFLVISCPCALVISIPLGYFGGIGAASKNGILFKGSNFLDIIANIQNVVMDKTGTMTEGVFKVQEVNIKPEYNKDEMLAMVNALESQSTHPVATAIHQYVGAINPSIQLSNTEEIAGHGLRAEVNGKELLVGNFKLMDKFSIKYDIDPSTIVYTLIAVAYEKKFAG